MGIAKHLDIRSLLEVYSYANTPRYLYRHFRENHSLTQLPQAYSPEDLIAEYRRRTDKASPSLEDVVVAYAIVVAVTFLPYKDAVSTFDQLELERLDWGGRS